MEARALRSPLYAVPARSPEEDGGYASAVWAVAGHFPGLPPTLAPYGAGVEVPRRVAMRPDLSPRARGQAEGYAHRVGRR